MVGHDTKSSVSSSISLTHENNSNLLNAFKEIHEELTVWPFQRIDLRDLIVGLKVK